MMHLLEKHAHVSSVLDYLRSVPRMGRNNLILADALGHIAVFEIGHSQTVARALEGALGRVDVPFAQQLMAIHAGPLASLCRHPSEQSQASTISASIFLPARRAMLFCHGLPCEGRYDEFVL